MSELKLSAVNDDEQLARLCWHPDDMDEDGHPMPTAFRKGDLKDPDGHLSVDRCCLIDPQSMMSTIVQQQANADENPCLTRDQAIYAILNTGEVRASKTQDNSGPQFTVDDRPVDGNPAHAGISSTTTSNRNKIKRLQQMLVNLVQEKHTYDELCAKYAKP